MGQDAFVSVMQTSSLLLDEIFFGGAVRKRRLRGPASKAYFCGSQGCSQGGSLFHTEACERQQPCSMERVEDVCVAATCAFVGSHLMTQWILEPGQQKHITRRRIIRV